MLLLSLRTYKTIYQKRAIAMLKLCIIRNALPLVGKAATGVVSTNKIPRTIWHINY